MVGSLKYYKVAIKKDRPMRRGRGYVFSTRYGHGVSQHGLHLGEAPQQAGSSKSFRVEEMEGFSCALKGGVSRGKLAVHSQEADVLRDCGRRPWLFSDRP